MGHLKSTLFRLIAITVGIWLMVMATAWPQASADIPVPPAKAPIVLDGRELFSVGDLESFTAQERADFANQVLHERVQQISPDTPIQVKLLMRGELITLRVAGRHLLTLTEQDLLGGITAEEQAELWIDRLQAALEQAQHERTPAYQQRVIWQILACALGVVGLSVLLRWMQRQLRRRRTQRPNWQLLWVEIGLLLLQWGVGLGGLLWITQRIPQLRSGRYQVMEFLRGTFSASIVTLGDRGYSVLEIGKILALIFGLWLLVRAFTSVIRSRVLQALGAERTVQDTIALLIQIILTTLGLLVLLQAVGVDISSLAILVSIVGVGVGFGLQNIANNFISGLIIMFERPVQVGDFVEVADLMGTVERIGIRSTEISTLDRVTILVPNAEFIDNKVINWSHGYPVSRLHIPLGVAYNSPIKTVRQVVLDAAKCHPQVLRYPRPQLWFEGFGASSLDFELLVWIREPRLQFRIRSDLYYLLEANLRRHQIEIPFPQRDLHIRTPHAAAPDAASLTASLFSTESSGEPQAGFTSPLTASDRLSDALDWADIFETADKPTADEITELVTQMRGPNGLDIRDRRFGLHVYAKCFIGSEAVQWFMKNQLASREEASKLGQILLENGIIRHVTDEHPFKDTYLFYRFSADEPLP